MDKEILRIVIIATGLLVMMIMLLLGYLKSRRSSDNYKMFEGEDIGQLRDSLKLHPEHDDFDVVPLSNKATTKTSATTNNTTQNPENKTRSPANEKKQPAAPLKVVPPPVTEPEEDFDFDFDFDYEPLDIAPKPRVPLPPIIQFSIVANADKGFNGVALFEAFETVGLQYGSLKIFERIGANRRVDFGVACMVEPGTFPNKNLQSFYCPGIVFFMQHDQLEDARNVFEDYLETIVFLASELDGVVWDHQRQPLTEATVEAIRRSL